LLFFPEYGFLAPIMTPSARIQSVQDLFHRILSNNRIQMDGIAGDYFRSRRFIGSKDRANIAERAYMMMRHFARLNWWCQKLDITPDARHLVLLYLILVEKMGKGDLAAIYDGSNYAPDPLDESELALSSTLFSKDIHDPDMPIDARYECPSATCGSYSGAGYGFC
jgi:16S rRNA (cytosine967-C5)-methyltransferase